MKKLLNKKTLIVADLLIIPAIIFCRWLSAVMLEKGDDCSWTLFGGKCVSCGGTHFVNSLTNGRIAEAFNYNQFLFLMLIVAVITLVLLHLQVFTKLTFPQKALRAIYSIPSLIIVSVIMVVFLVARNMPLIV